METMATYNYVPIEEDDSGYVVVNEYSELLKRTEWRRKRKEILVRDSHNCTKCNKFSTAFISGKHIKGAELVGRWLNGKPLYKPIEAKDPISLHIHHTFYVLERNPWYYNNKDLVTLCEHCHLREHKTNTIPVFLTEKQMEIRSQSNIIACFRCGGDGYLPHYNYYHDGVCFQCNGRCFLKKVKLE